MSWHRSLICRRSTARDSTEPASRVVRLRWSKKIPATEASRISRESFVEALCDSLGAGSCSDDFDDIVQAFCIDGEKRAWAKLRSKDDAFELFGALHGKSLPGILSKSRRVYVDIMKEAPNAVVSASRWPLGQQLLVDVEGIRGLYLVTEAVCVHDEERFAHLIDNVEWDDAMSRRVQHYGKKFDYVLRRATDAAMALPAWIGEISATARRWASQFDFGDFAPDQITINEYKPGQGINNHVDTHSAFHEPIVSLSLCSDIVMAFRTDDAVRYLLLPRRSMLFMTGESRFLWRHGIKGRKMDVIDDIICPRSRRLSVTLRETTDGNPCTCRWPQQCDSQQFEMPKIRMV